MLTSRVIPDDGLSFELLRRRSAGGLALCGFRQLFLSAGAIYVHELRCFH